MRPAWEALRRRVEPESDLSPDARAVFDAERTTYNVRIFRWVMPLGAIAHVAIGLALLRPGATPAQTIFLRNAFAIDAAMAVVACASAAIAWRKKPGRAQRVLGDVVVVAYVAMGALISANAQRVNATTQMFLLCAMASALFRARALVQIGAVVFGLLVVLAGVFMLQQDPLGRGFNPPTAIVFSAVAIFAFLTIERSRVRELEARTALGRLNADLERRVQEQVSEILERAREVEQLNVQLAEKVQARSRELSMALARLAGEDHAHPALARGTVLGDRVTIDEPIGEGGMGIVYRGFDRVANAPVAVKLVQAASVQELDGLHRFLREAQAMAAVRHPAVVRSLHVDVSEDGRLFQIMELVSGENLDLRIKRGGAIAAPIAARIGAVLAEALAAAHVAGIVHCDVKPSNVMLTRAAPGLKLLDFGVAKLSEARAAGATTARILGTPEFMAPEQFADRAAVTDRADVYALGLVIYECLTRRLPYDAQTPHGWLVAHTERPAIDVRLCVPEIDQPLADAIMGCLRKAAADRPSAAEVARALAAFADAAGAPPLEKIEWPPVALTPPRDVVPTVVSGRR